MITVNNLLESIGLYKTDILTYFVNNITIGIFYFDANIQFFLVLLLFFYNYSSYMYFNSNLFICYSIIEWQIETM